MVFVGIETPDENTLALAHKNQNLKTDIIESVKKIQGKGIEVLAGFILGFDSDKDDIFDRQIDFIRKAGISMAMVGLLTALPLTQLERRLTAEKRILDNASGNNTHDLELNFITKMPREKLLEGYKKVISTIYKPKNYFERTLTLINRLPRVRKPIKDACVFLS